MGSQGRVFDRETKVKGEVSLASDLTPEDGLETKNSEGNDLLEQILTQLKILNMHISTITESNIKEEDIS